MDKVTVVIPNYNGMKFLEECLGALMNQVPGTPAFGVLVVDNGSDDGSLDLIGRKFPGVSVAALPENTGFCHAVNVGIRSCGTPYVILLNNDTKVRPDFVKNLTASIERRKDAFSVSAKMLMWDDEGLVDSAGDRYCALGWAYSRGKGRPAENFQKPCRVFSACGGAAVYRRSVLDEIGLFDELHFAYLEDLDIGYRAGIFGYRSYFEPSAEVVHFGSASSGSRYNAWKTETAAANSVYVAAKNMPLPQLIWNLPFLLPGFFVKFLFFAKKRMGICYLRGLKTGLLRSLSEEGRAGKVPFRPGHLGNYLEIQWQLYANILRFLKKS